MSRDSQDDLDRSIERPAAGIDGQTSDTPLSQAPLQFAHVTDLLTTRLSGSTFADKVTFKHDFSELTLIVEKDDLHSLVRFLRDQPDLRFIRLVDITAVDGLGFESERRFSLIYHVHSFSLAAWARIEVPLNEEEAMPTLTDLWPGANWLEREIFDLFGIQFAGHPNLVRIFMPDDWVGHPLLKDYPFVPEEIEWSFNVSRVNYGQVVRRTEGGKSERS